MKNIGQEIDEENPPTGFKINQCEDRLLWNRVRRAAKSGGRSVREFCWMAIAGSVQCAEDDMIFGPNGDVIGSELALDDLREAAFGDSLD